VKDLSPLDDLKEGGCSITSVSTGDDYKAPEEDEDVAAE